MSLKVISSTQGFYWAKMTQTFTVSGIKAESGKTKMSIPALFADIIPFSNYSVEEIPGSIFFSQGDDHVCRGQNDVEHIALSGCISNHQLSKAITVYCDPRYYCPLGSGNVVVPTAIFLPENTPWTYKDYVTDVTLTDGSKKLLYCCQVARVRLHNGIPYWNYAGGSLFLEYDPTKMSTLYSISSSYAPLPYFKTKTNFKVPYYSVSGTFAKINLQLGYETYPSQIMSSLDYYWENRIVPGLESTTRTTKMNFYSSSLYGVKGSTVSMNLPSATYCRERINPRILQYEWEELAANIYGEINPGFSSNGIAFANDLRELKSQADDTLQKLRSLSHLGRMPNFKKLKLMADLFLSFHYGWKLFVADSKELLQSLAINFRRIRRSGFNPTTNDGSEIRYTVCLTPFAKCETELDKLRHYFDLDLDVGNLWDLLPWSFVVDWFVGVGECAEQAANYVDLCQVHDVIYACKSIVKQLDLDSSELSAGCGSCVLRYYKRTYSKELIKPTFVANVNNGLDHWVEAGALLISNR